VIIGMLVALLLAFVVGAWLHYRYWVARFSLSLDYALEERIATEDGSAIELRRLPRGEHPDDEAPPVLLVHGLALNHRNNDMTEDLSLGRHLARDGRDVWLLTLRCGREDLPWAQERAASFEAMARHDLPLAVREVLTRTGAERLDYVGFSMGGILLYASLGQTLQPAVLRRAVTIGSPARVRPPLAAIARLARWVPHWIVPTLRLRLASRMFAFAAEWLHTPIHRWIYNVDNIEPGLPARALVNGFVNIPSGLAKELLRWSHAGGDVRFEDTPVTESLRRATTPVLLVAGADDRLAPPESVALAFDAWGADAGDVDKQMRVVGVDQGCAADYGHGDLAIGRFVDQDVFEPVARFLAAPADALFIDA